MLAARFDELKLTGKLPSPQGVGLRLLELSQRSDVRLEDVVRVLSTDPTLTGRLLKLANSAGATGLRPATTAKEAAVRLGLRTVFAVGLSFSVVATNREGACALFDYDVYWSRSLAAAAAAQAIAALTGELPPSQAFTAALLARIGRLAMASIHPKEYGEVLANTRGTNSAALAQAERQAFGTDHHELGAALLADWRVPDAIVRAVALAGEPPPPDAPSDVQVFARHLAMAQDLARALTSRADAPPSVCAMRVAELAIVRERIGLDIDAFDQLWYDAVALWREWGALMSVPAKPELPLAELAARAARSLEAAEETPVEAAAPAAAPAEPTHRLEVLVVEDDAVSARLLVAQLAKEGHKTRVASNGRSGLAEALREMPDVVVSDWLMPEMDGVEMTRALRSTEPGRHVHVILLTGQDEEHRVVEAFDSGVDEYLTKPVKPRVLMARVRAAARTIALRKHVRELVADKETTIAAQAVLTRKLQIASLTDALTSLPNRRCAMERLHREATRATQGAAGGFAVLMLDIDHFKQVNDAHGHDAGDEVLKAVAATVRRAVRRGDLVCRIGGEEFLVLCPNADERVARAVGERVRTLVAATTVDRGGFRGTMTVSIGTAVWKVDGVEVDDLLRAADRRLYLAKRAGRDCVVTKDPLAQAG
jgi:two-component system, cell cycle response regulator